MDINYAILAKAAMSHVVGYNPEIEPEAYFKEAGFTKKDLVSLIWENQVVRKEVKHIHHKNKLPARGHYIPADEPTELGDEFASDIHKFMFSDKAIIGTGGFAKYKNWPTLESYFGDIAELKANQAFHMTQLQRMMLEDCIMGYGGQPVPLQVEAVDKTPRHQRLEVIQKACNCSMREADIIKQAMIAMNINLKQYLQSGLSIDQAADLADQILQVEQVDKDDVYANPESLVNYEFWCIHQESKEHEEPEGWLDENLMYDTDSSVSTATTGFIPWLGWHDDQGWAGTGYSDSWDEPWILKDELVEILQGMTKAAETGDLWAFDDLRELVFGNIQPQDNKWFWKEYKILKPIALKNAELNLNKEYYEAINLINSAKSDGQLRFYGAWLYCQSSGSNFSGNIKVSIQSLSKPQIGLLWKLYREKQDNLIAYYGMEPQDVISFLTDNYK